MKIDDVADDLIISSKIHDCYLLYTYKDYYLYKPDNNSYTAVRIDINEEPTDVEDSIINIDVKTDGIEKISTNREINGSLKFMMLHLNMIGLNDETAFEFLVLAIADLCDVIDGMKDRFKRFFDIEDENIIKSIIEISKTIKKDKSKDSVDSLFYAFKNRKGIQKAQRDLGHFLNTECGIILRINSHDLYKLDRVNNGYNSTSIDEIIADLTEIFGENNLFSTKDVETAVDFISERLRPTYNIVKFNNGLYDMKQHQLFIPDEPIFTLVESPFNYNPDAEPKYITDYLNSTFERESEDETKKEIKGVLQVLGYLFTSGNIYNALIFLTGIGGAGKGTLASIIMEIFKGITTQLDFSEIEKDIHATSILVGNHLNIVKESDDNIVESNKHYKLLSGNDAISVNPKFKQPYEVPSDEVPKSVMNYNNLPNFKNPDVSTLQRFVIIEFKKIFRNTTDDVKDLAKLIINSKSDMEWLIYNSLKQYKEMVESGEDFILRLSEKETLELLYKHSQPLNYLIRKLILKHDAKAFENEVKLSDDAVNGETEFISPYIIANELNQLIVYLAKKEGVQIPLEKKTGKASSRKLLKAIKDEFDLHDYYITISNSSKKYTTVTKRINEKSQRIYPELIKTDVYNELLKEMKSEETENKRLDEFNAIMKKHMQ